MLDIFFCMFQKKILKIVSPRTSYSTDRVQTIWKARMRRISSFWSTNVSRKYRTVTKLRDSNGSSGDNGNVQKCRANRSEVRKASFARVSGLFFHFKRIPAVVHICRKKTAYDRPVRTTEGKEINRRVPVAPGWWRSLSDVRDVCAAMSG